MMSSRRRNDRKAVYVIRILGKLDPSWSDWFDGFEITMQDGETLLVGAVVDQASLLGLLSKIQNLGLELIALDRKMEEDR